MTSVFSARDSRRRTVHWPYVVPIFSVHLLALLACVPALFSWTGLLWLIVGVHLYGTLGINLCYHRLLTHRSFRVPKWLERSFATLALCCLQDTPIRWVATHRLHHNHADDEAADPHSPQENFVWGHMGWLFRRNSALRTLSFYEKYARDLLTDRYYFFLEKRPAAIVWIYLAHGALYALAGLAGGWWWSGSLAAGAQLAASWVVWGVLLRTVVVWHITWSVNSLTHRFGYQTYETGEHSRNNWLVALLAAGEGWHNNHHHDPASASVQHRWWEFDLTYYVIRCLSLVGLARNIVQPRFVRRAERSP